MGQLYVGVPIWKVNVRVHELASFERYAALRGNSTTHFYTFVPFMANYCASVHLYCN